MKKVELVFKFPDDKECLSFVLWSVSAYCVKDYLVSINIDDCVAEFVEEDKE